MFCCFTFYKKYTLNAHTFGRPSRCRHPSFPSTDPLSLSLSFFLSLSVYSLLCWVYFSFFLQLLFTITFHVCLTEHHHHHLHRRLPIGFFFSLHDHYLLNRVFWEATPRPKIKIKSKRKNENDSFLLFFCFLSCVFLEFSCLRCVFFLLHAIVFSHASLLFSSVFF